MSFNYNRKTSVCTLNDKDQIGWWHKQTPSNDSDYYEWQCVQSKLKSIYYIYSNNCLNVYNTLSQEI